jgi:hypothetical protein
VFGQGQIFASGLSIMLTAPGTSLRVPAANGALKYILLVDSDGNPIVPVYEATTVDGVAMAGVRIALPSVGALSALDARVNAAETDIDLLESVTTTLIDDLTAANGDISMLDGRVDAVEPYAVGGGLWTVTPVKTASYTAGFGEFVQVDLDSAAADVTVTLPAPAGAPPGSQIMVADISTTGAFGSGHALKIAATFGSPASAATSPYTVAGNVGARIHLIVNHDSSGWQIFSETQRP